jgi:hypothetical protein
MVLDMEVSLVTIVTDLLGYLPKVLHSEPGGQGKWFLLLAGFTYDP